MNLVMVIPKHEALRVLRENCVNPLANTKRENESVSTHRIKKSLVLVQIVCNLGSVKLSGEDISLLDVD